MPGILIITFCICQVFMEQRIGCQTHFSFLLQQLEIKFTRRLMLKKSGQNMRGNYARIITTFMENCHQRHGWGRNAQQQWLCCDKSIHLPFVLLNAWTVCC